MKGNHKGANKSGKVVRSAVFPRRRTIGPKVIESPQEARAIGSKMAEETAKKLKLKLPA